MRKIFTSASLLLLPVLAQAQITLNQSSYTNLVVTTDTFGRVVNNIPVMTTGGNQQWDFTGVTYENTTYYSEQPTGTHPSFPGATWNTLRRYKLGTNEFTFDTKRWSGITAVGLERIGEEVARQAVLLTGVASTVNTDSLVIKQQNIVYSSSYPLVKFPATMGSSWTAKFDFVVEMELTYANMGFNKAPMQYKVTTEYTFTTPGWGKAFMQFKDNAGVYGEDNVLLVRIGGTTVDSFFINGQPISLAAGTALGLVQNKTSNNHWDELFRDQEVSALVLYSYGANVFTNAESAEIHQLRVPPPNDIKSVSADGSMALYPNPVKAGGQLFVKLQHANAGDYTYSISNITGSITAKGSSTANGNVVPVSLPASFSNGIYWLTLQHNGVVVGTAPFRYAD